MFNGKTLSYKELDTLSNQLASCLQKKYSIQSEDLVGIQLERSEWMIVSILGVLKAGGAYVPIDPEDPSSRKDHIIKDASLKLLITEVNFIHDIDYYEGEIFAIDVEFDAASYSTEYTKADLHPDQLAYVIYTSGSTGNPKGVMISLGSLMDYSFGVMEKTNIRECERFGLVSTIAADLGNTVVYTSLLIGGSLHIISKEDLLDVNKLQNSNLDCLKLTPSHWKALQNDDLFYVPNKCLILGGEEFSEEILNRIKINEAVCEVYNHYGPTETTIGKLIQRIDKNQSTFEISLGTPMGNNQVYVLDSSQELCPVGVSGEICISGAGLARGYLNQEALTKEKFIANPFKAGERLYRTGDLGKRTKAGQIKFIGRKDDQVKIRGYRVELGEVEQGLLTNKEIKQAVVLARENQQKVKELVAYIVAESDQNSNTLRTYLKEILPEYMLPSYYVQLKALPLTSNGKIDKKSLPNPEGMGLTSGLEYVGPKNELEEKLVELWQTVLKRENIGIKDDFFSLGGHSLKALRLSNEYQKELSVMIPLKELFTHTTIESHAALISSSKRSAFIQIEKIAHQESYAISDAQRRLWVLAQFEGGSAAYNSPKIIYLNQEIETENFKKAIAATIDRHEILRTVFKEDASGEIRQWILEPKDLGFEIKYEDFRKEKNKEEKVKNYIAEDSYKAFDLERGPLLRASLLQIEDESYVFYYNMHHIISDGWSVDVLSKDVLSYYQAFKDNVLPSLEELRIQYKDYSAWQLAQLESESFASHRAYWLNSLGGELPLLDLPSTKKRPRIKTNNGHGLSTYIDKATTAKLKKYSQENGGSLFMGLLAVWNILMYRYTSQKDIIIGTPIAGREHADLEDQIGFYINTLALRNEIRSEETFDDLFLRVKQNTLDAYVHQMYPFDRLVEELDLARDMSRSPIFDISITYHNILNVEDIGMLDDTIVNQILDSGLSKAKNDMELHFQEEGKYLSFDLKYNTDIYDREMIERLMVHYKQLLSSLLEIPKGKISQIDYLSDQEKQKLLFSFNSTKVDYPKDKTIIDLFEEQVNKTPNAIAVVFEEKELTYKEVNEKSTQLARYLQVNHKIQADDLVGIQLDRSEWMIIAILGVLKSGGAYVPIDPEYPSSRKEYIVKDTSLKLLITEANYIYDIDYYDCEIFAIDLEFVPEKYSSEIFLPTITSNNLAYVIYTSGSTGQPKGVMIEHQTVINTILSQIEFLRINSTNKGLQFASFSFDASVWESFLILLSGASLLIINRHGRNDPKLLTAFINAHEIDIATLPPSYLNKIDLKEIKGLKTLITAGESGVYEKAKEHLEYGTYYNAYGPTETSICATMFKLENKNSLLFNSLPIGKPISNTQIYILSEEKGLQPVGVPGEICIGGSGLARGYLNQEALTREKFIANPFKAGDRLYKTGDLGRWLPDGNVEFIGRKDDQVKIRGYRIELGEIEHALLKNEAIEEAVVLAKTNDNNEKELVAYLVSKEEQNTSELRSYLQGILPEYMVPSYFVQLEALPLTSNGKIDKKNLPDPKGLGLASGVEYVAPRNEIEEKLVEIWSEILGIDQEKIGIKDKFFELGGDSIKVLRMISNLRKKINYQLSVSEIYNNDTIEKIVAYASENKKKIDVKNKEREEREKNIRREISALKERILLSGNILDKENIDDIYPMSDIEKGMVFGSLINEGAGVYHDQMISQRRFFEFDIERFKQALVLLTERHSILRTGFNLSDYECEVQIVYRKIEIDLHYSDVSDLTKEDQEDVIKMYLRSERDRGFVIATAPLWRMSVFALGGYNYAFVFQCHHAIIDGWSDASFKTELNNLYLKLGEDINYKPIPLKSDYKDFIVHYEANKQDAVINDFWKRELSGYERLDLFTDQDEVGKYSKVYDNDYLKKVENLAKTLNTTVKVVSLSAYLYMLKVLNYNTEIVTGLVTNIRPSIDDGDKVLGCFLNTIPLKIQVDGNLLCGDFIRSVQKKLIELKNNESFSLLEISSICQEKSDRTNPFFDIMFNYVDFHAYQDVVEDESKEISNSSESNINVAGHGRANTFFDFNISTTDGGYSLLLNATRKIKSNLSLEQVGTLYFKILDFILKDSEKQLKDIDYLSAEEKQKLLFSFNDTKVAYPKDKTIIDLFEEQVNKTPNNVAVVFEEKELTYKELDELSNQLADYLQKHYAIEPDDLIGIKQDRSEWMIVSILGVLKSGGAYVPIDPGYPQDRIAYIEQDTNCKVCIDEKELNKFKKGQKKHSREKIKSVTKSGDLAYVIYTSGSTGQPKGVLVEHSGVVNRLLWMRRDLGLDESDVFLQKTPTTFDVSVWELLLPLITGSKLVVARPGGQKDPAYLEQVIVDFKISLIHFVPSMLSGMLENIKWDKFESLRHVICSGEALSKKLESSFKEKSSITKLHNYYGPTEASVDVTAIDLTQFATTRSEVSIGKPVDNTQIYILSEEKGLQPVGVPGEILIGGVQIARGYLNQEALTREKFIANPFKAGDRLYKTGDLGRWLPDGNIEFIGRKDDQVKIRGYRIELGEIEHALLKNEAIEEAVVLAKTNDNNEKELVAYLVSKEEQNTSELRSYLKGILPEYMLPVYFVQLEAMPLTSNGKIDKKNLPDPEGLGLASGVEYVAPRNEQEKVLVFVWSDVLKREGIGIKDSFYNLGGDSIKSIQVVSRLKQQGYSLKIEHILRTPVVEELARLMQHSIHVVDQSAVKGRIELTPIQEWFFSNPLIKVKHHFNQSILLQSKEAIDKKILEKSISDLSKHHDALRMFYKKTEAGWEQINGDIDSKSYTLDFYDLRRSDNAIEEMSELGEQLQSSIDLSGGPLFRVVHFRLKDGDRLGLILHHLVVDGVSWRILLEDLSSLYTSYKEGKPAGLVLKTDSFQRWSLLQKEYAESNKIKTERTYWEDICSQEIESLFQDKEVEAGQASLDASESFKLDKVTTELLQTRVHGVYNTEINDVLLTGLGLAIKEALSREKSVLKVEGHGREDIIAGVDISRTVGWFTTMYPFVLDVSKSVSQTECLVKVKESLRRVPNKGIGYGILKYLSEVGIESKITPEIVFNYLGDFGSNAGNDEKSLFDYASEHMGSSSSKENGNEAILDISGMLVMGELSMSIRYSKSRYDSVTIKKLVKSYEKVLKSLIKELAKSRATYLTPSDLSFKGLNVEELSEINSGNNVEDVYELSPLQTGIYYHWLSEVSNSLYFKQMSYRIRAKGLEVGKLKRAYDALIARHGVLRTSFSNDYAGRPLQTVQKGVPSKFSYEKLADSKDKQGYIEQIKQEDREKGFDLNSSSQMRLHIIDLSEGEYEFIWSHHHILMDGWCMSVLVNDFNQLLSAEIMGTALDMAPVMPYSNYINWLNTIDKESSLAYWKDYLADYTEIAEIPFTIKTEQASYVESSKHLQLDGELFKKVDTLCNQIGITHNTFIQAVWGYLLSRYNNTNDVVFGAVVSGRPADLHGVEDMIGLFINTIPVRIKYESGDTPIKLLRSIQEQSIQSTSHHYLNLSEVQSQSKLGMRLIDHIMIFENYAVKDLEGEGVLNTQREEGLSIESMDVFEQTNYDFNIVIAPLSGSMVIDIKYNSNRYDSLSLNRLAEHFDNLISAFTSHADEPLHKIDYLSAEEKQKLLFSFNDTKVAYPKDKTIIDLFEEQVNKTPNNVAVVFEEKELTYKELDELSNQLADYLQKHYAIEPDDLIGIKQDRSEWMIVSILGVLKSGGAYVPIDPGYPQDRIAYIEQDTNCKVCIDEKELNKFQESQGIYSKERSSNLAGHNNLAYVIYTSGSTGQPKGVLVEHQTVINTILSQIEFLQINSTNKGLQFASFSFDASVSESFLILLSGASLLIINRHGRNDPKLLTAFINAHEIDIATLPPSYLNKIDLKEIKGLKTLITAGESGVYEKAKEHLEYGTYYNAYGPTETSICATMFKLENKNSLLFNSLPIGKPISNTQIYILSEEKGLQPVGVPGEICIGGSGLARGYLNQEALTREKFIANPFKAGDRLYKTGDLGRWLPDGNVEFIGRKDDQVKIRGYRIELGEIEHALLKNEAIEEAVVLAKTNDNNEKELVAYLVSKEEQNTSELRSYLQGILPEYMVPSYFVQLEALPLTSNGKIDKKNLPDPKGLGLASGVEYVAPRNEIEEKLVKIWEEILQRENIGVKDDFFALGGHSIKAIKVISLIQSTLNHKIDIRKIFMNPNIENICLEIENAQWINGNKDKNEVKKIII